MAIILDGTSGITAPSITANADSSTFIGIKTDKLSNSAGTGPAELIDQSAAKAHVHFDAAGGTPTIVSGRAFNVASITDNAVGIYIPNFTNAMDTSEYAAGASQKGSTAIDIIVSGNSLTTTGYIRFRDGAVDTDIDGVSFWQFGTLA